MLLLGKQPLVVLERDKEGLPGRVGNNALMSN